MTFALMRVATIALAITAASSFAQAQTSPTAGATSTQKSDVSDQLLTEERIDIVKAALQLRPEQTQYWPALERAIRERGKGRQARLAAASDRLRDMGDRSTVEILQGRDPVAFLQRRSANLTQRATELKNLADAWQPIYQTMSPEQKRRMTILAVLVLRELRDKVEQRRMDDDDDDED